MVKNKIKRSIPLFLALFVLISCLPVIPSAADEIYLLDGTWRFNSDISWSSNFDFFYPSFVSISDTPFDSFNYIFSEDQLWLYNQGEDVCVYNSGQWEGALPFVVFSERVQVTKDEYAFFQQNLTQTSSPSAIFSTTLNIDGQLFNFFGTGSSPLVQMTVDVDGCTLTDGTSSRQFVYSGSGTFKGFSVSSGGSLNYSIGSTWTFGGKASVDSLYSLFSVVEDDSQPVYSSSITINGVTETFTSTGSAPSISMQVLDTGAVFTAAGKSVPYVYEGEGSFLGFSFSPSGDPSFTPGNTYELASGSHTLYPISDAPLPDQLTTTVNIYNNAGTQLLYSFKASSADASPRVTVAPSASSITFTVPDQDPFVFSGVYSSFTGLALKPQATAPAVVLGQTLSFGGNTSDSVLDLYCTYESGFVDPSGTDFVSWLATAVGGFLAFELWPGMSLDQVLWVILVIGILMWFLKVIV